MIKGFPLVSISSKAILLLQMGMGSFREDEAILVACRISSNQHGHLGMSSTLLAWTRQRMHWTSTKITWGQQVSASLKYARGCLVHRVHSTVQIRGLHMIDFLAC